MAKRPSCVDLTLFSPFGTIERDMASGNRFGTPSCRSQRRLGLGSDQLGFVVL